MAALNLISFSNIVGNSLTGSILDHLGDWRWVPFGIGEWLGDKWFEFLRCDGEDYRTT